MAAVRHLGFLKVGHFNCTYPSEGQNASSYRILCKSVKALQRYGRLHFFQAEDGIRALVRSRGLGDVYKRQPLGGPKCVIVPNFVQIGQGVAEIWPFSIFQDGGRPPSWIFKRSKF